jgi:glycosyltransferase involved in cell wall biosynthesis
VSQALKDRLAALGVASEKVEVLRNGVDLTVFKPVERRGVRQRLGLKRRTVLSVGNLLAFKGHAIAIEALRALPDCELLIVGSGPDQASFETLARKSGLAERVRFAGLVDQQRLADYYCAADVLVLASSREGWPNVLLEAMACGTPAIATAVGGASEIITCTDAGLLLRERTAQALAQALQHLFANYPNRAATRGHAEQFSWAPTTIGQIQLFERVIKPRAVALQMRTSAYGQ